MQVHCPLSQDLRQRFKGRCKNGNASAPVCPSAEAVTRRNTPVRGQDHQKHRGDEQNNENCEDIMLEHHTKYYQIRIYRESAKEPNEMKCWTRGYKVYHI
jgi:hypothetical protein